LLSVDETAVRVGSRLRFVPSELLAYLEKHREERVR
jgi:hypothetical protein